MKIAHEIDEIGVSVYCLTCGKRKKPIGRDAAPAIANSLCDQDCPGWREEPYPGDLWPGEKRSDFGFGNSNE